MSEEYKVITPEALELLRIGEIWGSTTHEITDTWLKTYAMTIRDTNPLWFDEDFARRESRFGYRFCPAAFCTVLNPAERNEISPQMEFFGRLRGLPEGQGSWGFAAYNRVEYYNMPIRVGDTITCDVSVSDAYEKYSKKAVIVFVDVLYSMRNQADEKVGDATAGVAQTFAVSE